MGTQLTTTKITCLALLGLASTSTQALAAGCGQLAPSITNLQVTADLVLQVNALSANGDLAGYYYSDTQDPHAFVYSEGQLIDPGTLGGPLSEALAINGNGEIVGDSLTEAFQFHGFVGRTNLNDLGSLGSDFSRASLINDAGVIAGNSFVADFSSFNTFSYSNGVMSDLGTLGGGYATPFGINSNGVIVGLSINGNGESHGFVSENGSLLDLGTLGGTASEAMAINDLGLIVGDSTLLTAENHAFAYASGTMVDLGTFGGTYSTAYGVNNKGQVIGYANIAADAGAHAFVWQDNVMTDLGTLGGTNSYPSAINNAGQIVGSSDTTQDGGHAFLWQNGTMLDLNALVDGSGWVLLDARFINDAGRIVGDGIYNGVQQTYIMDLGSNDHAPVAAAGNDQVAECGSDVTLDGSASSDPDGDELSFQWGWNGYLIGTNAVISTSLPLGTNTVTLFVSDACGMFSETNVTIIVRDTTAPVIVGAPATVTVSVGAACTAQVPNLLSGLQLGDTCSASNELTVSQSVASGTTLAKGSYPVTITAADPSGNHSSVVTVLNLVDTTAPTIQSVSATPNILTSPNKKMMPVAVSVSATDNCDTTLNSQIICIKANETVAPGDIQITGALSASLAADRNAGGSGRVYTLTVRTSDSSGNSSLKTVTVSVPQGNGNK